MFQLKKATERVLSRAVFYQVSYHKQIKLDAMIGLRSFFEISKDLNGGV